LLVCKIKITSLPHSTCKRWDDGEIKTKDKKRELLKISNSRTLLERAMEREPTTSGLEIEQCPSSPTSIQKLDMASGAFDQIVRKESARLIRKTGFGIGTFPASIRTSGSVGYRFEPLRKFQNEKGRGVEEIQGDGQVYPQNAFY